MLTPYQLLCLCNIQWLCRAMSLFALQTQLVLNDTDFDNVVHIPLRFHSSLIVTMQASIIKSTTSHTQYTFHTYTHVHMKQHINMGGSCRSCPRIFQSILARHLRSLMQFLVIQSARVMLLAATGMRHYLHGRANGDQVLVLTFKNTLLSFRLPSHNRSLGALLAKLARASPESSQQRLEQP
ncbi:hypothetical protein V8C86DRAFT_2891519 [Haematococcus lacustris]